MTLSPEQIVQCDNVVSESAAGCLHYVHVCVCVRVCTFHICTTRTMVNNLIVLQDIGCNGGNTETAYMYVIKAGGELCFIFHSVTSIILNDCLCVVI